MKAIKEHFEEFKNPCYFSRVDNNHILGLHIGLDDKGRKCIELRTKKFSVRRITGTNVIEVGQFKNNNYYSIRFTLINDEMSGLFYKFCEDLVEETRTLKLEEEGYQAVVERYLQWKRMFVSSKKDLLTEIQIMGLIGEILFLKGNLAERIGLSNALKSWSGQELTHKDFSYKDSWFECKAISRSTLTVKISSLEQLDSNVDGELVVYSLEKMSEVYNGISLNNLILDTAKLFETAEEKEDFLSKVALQGYEYNTYYDSFVYEISSFHRYLVNDDFPKLTRKQINKAISSASYVLSMPEIAPFEIKEK